VGGRTYVTRRLALVTRLLGFLVAVHIFGDRVRRSQTVTTRSKGKLAWDNPDNEGHTYRAIWFGPPQR
jgi:hypothetical protein